jgi:N-formylglutamate amidohydrolase
VRGQILLDDNDLLREIIRLTDWHTDHLFSWVLELGTTMFVNAQSRLVFDPERFVDDEEEPMARKGQGVVYTKTTDGRVLSEVAPEERALRIREFNEPYHKRLTTLVATIIEEFGICTIVDCHSFATDPLPSEPDQSANRPDICIGTDAFHTVPRFAERLEESLTREGFRVKFNAPFAGTFVPGAYYHKDARVKSVLIEVRRGLYCVEGTGERIAEYDDVREALRRGISNAYLPLAPYFRTFFGE